MAFLNIQQPELEDLRDKDVSSCFRHSGHPSDWLKFS